ncbi:hypothetical protein C8R44DRAFT_799693 [Mycena epipterygia]|nr:hypothetical protein C8R44DRAFT_799693 [Mycena epipterygia]
MITAILELATMVQTMETNQDDIYKLATCLTELIAINPSGGSEDLRLRLAAFTSNLQALAAECQSIAAKSRSKQFFNSKSYKEAIQQIRNSIASHIQDFTFYNHISIAKAVEDMATKVNHVLKNEIIATLECVPARYNAENA